MPRQKFVTTISHTLDFDKYLEYLRDLADLGEKYPGMSTSTEVRSLESPTLVKAGEAPTPKKISSPQKKAEKSDVVNLENSEEKLLTPRQAIAILMSACRVTTYKQLAEDFLNTPPGKLSLWCNPKVKSHPGKSNRDMLTEALEVFADMPGVIIVEETRDPELQQEIDSDPRGNFMPVALYTQDVVDRLLSSTPYDVYGGAAQLARDIGVSSPSISHWWSGANAASGENLQRLQEVFRAVTGNYDALILPGLRPERNAA